MRLKYFYESFLIVLFFASIAQAKSYDQYFVTVEWLEQNIGKDMVIIDARSKKAYDKGHIPGSLPIFWKQLSDMSPKFAEKNWGTVTNKEILSKAISNLGITYDSKIIIYADTQKGWGEDGRIFWTFKIAGLKDLKILDGGIRSWKKNNGDITTKQNKPLKTNFVVSNLNLSKSIDTDTIKNNYTDYKYLDTRSKEEFNGAVKFGEKRGGHLPGAILLSYKNFLQDGLLKPKHELINMLKAKGIQKKDPLVSYCTAGIRSAYVQVVLEMLGFNNIKSYDESFYVWANDPETQLGLIVKNKPYNFITAAQLHTRLNNNKSPVIIDIQPHEDFIKHHIPGAIETASYPVKTSEDKKKLEKILPDLKKTGLDIAVVCPIGKGGARRTIDFLKLAGISSTRLYILENGQKGWNY